MYREISEKFIIKTLKEYERRTKSLREEMSKQYALLNAQDDDAIRTVSYPAIDNTMINTCSSEVIDIVDIYEKYCDVMRQRALDIQHQMREIIEEQETMNRIMSIYTSLEPREQDVLNELYIQNSSGKTIHTISLEVGERYELSHQSILRIRKQAMNKIIELYNSDLTQTEILQYKEKDAVCLKNIKNKYR